MRTAALFAVLLAGTLMLAEPAAGYVWTGNGTKTCEAWTAARKTPQGTDTQTNEQWVVGFMSGIGSMALGELDPLHGIDADGVYRWFDKYCRDHPPETIEAASRAFIQDHPR